MDKNQIIGFGLIFALLIGYTYLTKPTEAEIRQIEARQDSIRQAQNIDTTKEIIPFQDSSTVKEQINLPDTVRDQLLSKDFGPFAQSASGEDKEVVLENDVLKITFSTKGAQIKSVLLKEYKKNVKQLDNTFKKEPLLLLEDKKDKFEYIIPVANTTKGTVKSSDLYFEATIEGDEVSFKASAGEGRYLEQKYSFKEKDNYFLKYDVAFIGLDKVIPDNAKNIQLNWDNYLDKLEKNASYERSQYSGIHYKETEDGPSCIGNDREELKAKVHWISSAQQFFNTSLIADNSFTSAVIESVALEEEDIDLKKNSAEILIPYTHSSDETFPMQMYIGPNDFERLRAADMQLEDVIEFGWGIFGTINRWIIRPVFNFLSGFIGSAGIVILLLTFLIKLVLYPLTYKMLYSQAKMGALKPQLEKIKEKTGDDQQAYSVEQMNLYRETGVSPLGGCFPMLLQMPIWFALYRFFPASIDFRQEGFLWADDLSSYDSIWTFGDVPILSMIQFDHVSLFTILWAVTTLIYTYYNTKHMTMPNPAMKYVQYFMPIMFIFFFNSFASGLTCYLLFSNLFNITQTIVTKNFLIDNDKLAAQLEENKKKPKKQSKFQEKLQDAMKQQQELQKKQAAEKGKKTVEERKNRKNNKK
jgi:YidC/Oxa1 family membrane protein insertase